tara:strand:+ start:125 stop:601 length:477 start_codon:yes stop_codon:yes gene_type:complete
MKQTLRIETFYVKPPVNIDEILNDLDWFRRDDKPVKANVTDWNVSNYFPDLCSQLHVLYPKHKINELWVASYERGDYSEAHDHRGFDWSFVWYLDACTSCNPISFPNLKHPWLTHEHIYPKVGSLHVFDADLVHYVAPHTCHHHERIVVSGNLIHNEG